MKIAVMPALLALALAFFAGPAMAEEKVRITADRFVVAESANLATFTGNVVVVQGTVTVDADKVEVHYGAGGASDIESLVAAGHVVIVTPTQHVTGQRANYDPKTKILVVSGDVVSENASGRVTGSELRVNLAANTTEFAKKDGGRVTGVFNP